MPRWRRNILFVSQLAFRGVVFCMGFQWIEVKE